MQPGSPTCCVTTGSSPTSLRLIVLSRSMKTFRRPGEGNRFTSRLFLSSRLHLGPKPKAFCSPQRLRCWEKLLALLPAGHVPPRGRGGDASDWQHWGQRAHRSLGPGGWRGPDFCQPCVSPGAEATGSQHPWEGPLSRATVPTGGARSPAPPAGEGGVGRSPGPGDLGILRSAGGAVTPSRDPVTDRAVPGGCRRGDGPPA